MDGPRPARHRSRSPEPLSQRDTDNVLNLHHRGLPAESISQTLGLPIDGVVWVLEQQSSSAPSNSLVAKALLKVLTLNELAEMHFLQGSELENEVRRCQQDPEFFRLYITAISERSQKFRCSLSHKLMKLPVVGQDGRFYEKTTSNAFASYPVMQNLKLEAANFARALLHELSFCYRLQRDDPDSLAVVIDLLNVLDPQDDLVSYAEIIRSLNENQTSRLLTAYLAVDSKALARLKLLQDAWLKDQVLDNALLNLTRFLCEIYLTKSPKQAQDCLLRHLLCTEQRPDLRLDAIKLAVDIGLKLSRPLLSQVIDVLEPMQLTGEEESWHLAELKMRVAELLTIEGKTAEALSIINSLKSVWSEEKRFKAWLLNYSIKHDKQMKDYEMLTTLIEANFPQMIEQGLPDIFNETLIYLLQLVRIVRSDASVSYKSHSLKVEQLEKQVESHNSMLTRKYFSNEFEALRAAESRKIEKRLEKIEADHHHTNSSRSRTFTRPPLQEVRPATSQFDDILPKYIYSTRKNSNQLFVTDLTTGSSSEVVIEGIMFRSGCQHVQIPDTGCLFFSGGGPSTEVMHIKPNFAWRSDLLGGAESSWGVERGAPMNEARSSHGSLYFEQKVYVLGGKRGKKIWLKTVECYNFGLNSWEILPDMPLQCCNFTPQVLERTQQIYVIGGHFKNWSDRIQEYSIPDRLWTIIDVKLPLPSSFINCFKMGRDATSVFLVTKGGLHSFDTETETVKFLKRTADEQCLGGPCYLSKGILYCSYDKGPARQVMIGNLFGDD